MKKWFIKAIVFISAALCIIPLIITVSNSFMSSWEIAEGAHVFPRDISIYQYEQVLLRSPQYLLWFWNSVKILFFTVILAIPLSVSAGFGFSKFQFPGRDIIFFLYIIILLLPFQATLVPQYITLNHLNLLDTTAAVVLPNAFSAFGAFMMTQFMKNIDDEIVDAGKIDGLSHWGVFIYIIVPLSKTAVAALFILLFIECWSMIEQPLIFLTDQGELPLSLYLGNISSNLYAAGTIYLILPLLVYLLAHDELVEGISYSGIK